MTAGDVIGYMGHTGYSTTENTNNIKVTHLHWGMELVFDESQKESDHEIWINVYPLTMFLSRHQSETVKVEGTKEWKRVSDIRDPAVTLYLQKKRFPGEFFVFPLQNLKCYDKMRLDRNDKK